MIKGNKRTIPLKPKLDCNLHNRFDIEVINSLTGEVKQKAQAENTICTNLWARLFNATEANRLWNNYIHYGTGSGTPSENDTSLFTFSGYKTPAVADDLFEWGDDGASCSLKRKIQLSETEAVGITLSEVGIGYGTAASTLCTHAMLKDMNGNPISINKTNIDVINIYATVYVHWSVNGYDNSHINFIRNKNFFYYFFGTKINGEAQKECSLPNRLIFRPGSGYGYGSTYEVWDENESDNGVGKLTPTMDLANKKITLELTRLPITKANFGGVRSVYSSCNNLDTPASNLYTQERKYASMFFDLGGSWFNTSLITGEAIGTGDGATVDFTTAFPEVSNPTIYIDGVFQGSGVTVYTGMPGNLTNFGYEFNRIDENCNKMWGVLPVSAASNIPYIGGTYYYENPWYETVGVASMVIVDGPTASTVDIYVSNDFENWTRIYKKSDNDNLSIPVQYQNYRYFKFYIVNSFNGTAYASSFKSLVANISTTNIHFATPPAEGAVITADYTTKCIAKDINHVFDFSMEITIGEHIV